MSWLSEEHEAWIKERSCTRKKRIQQKEGLEIITAKPHYAMYFCKYCGWFHLTKSAAHSKYKDSKNKADDEITGINPVTE